MKAISTQHNTDAIERKHPWPMVRLGDVCDEIKDRIQSSNIAVGEYVTTDNMVKDRGGIVQAEYVPSDVGLVEYHKGDVLIANIRPYLKKIWLADHDGGCSSDVVVFRTNTDGLSSEYLYSVLSQDAYFEYVMQKPRGTKMPRGDRDWMKEFRFPLPSLSVQREIVARLERELAAVEKMKKGFEALAETAKQEFKAELKEVFEGLKSGGAEIGTDGTNGTVETRRLGEIGRVVTGTTPSKGNKSYYGGEWPFYKPADLNQGRNTIGSGDSLADAGWQSARQLPANSVLVTCIGATLGKTGIIRREGSCNQQINAIVCDGKTLPEYVYYSILSPQFQNMLWQSSNSTTLPMVNKSTFEKFEIPFPALAVQREVVARLDLAKARAEKLEAKAREGVSVCETMRKAILKEAFE